MWRSFSLSRTMGVMFCVSAPVFAANTPEPLVNVKPTGLHVVINLPQTRLFVYKDGKLERDFPVAVGKLGTRTPVGEYSIGAIHHNPAWHVPLSIQREMQKQGKPVVKVVPPGAGNPLGKVFVRFGPPSMGLGIHGTNAPNSVPGFRSHGCVRMKNPDALLFAKQVSNGVPVSVVYQPLLLNTDDAGELWLTALPDAYRRGRGTEVAKNAAEKWAKESARELHLSRWQAALKRSEKTITCLTCERPNSPVPKTLYALNTQTVPAETLPTITEDMSEERVAQWVESVGVNEGSDVLVSGRSVESTLPSQQEFMPPIEKDSLRTLVDSAPKTSVNVLTTEANVRELPPTSTPEHTRIIKPIKLVPLDPAPPKRTPEPISLKRTLETSAPMPPLLPPVEPLVPLPVPPSIPEPEIDMSRIPPEPEPLPSPPPLVDVNLL